MAVARRKFNGRWWKFRKLRFLWAWTPSWRDTVDVHCQEQRWKGRCLINSQLPVSLCYKELGSGWKHWLNLIGVNSSEIREAFRGPH